MWPNRWPVVARMNWPWFGGAPPWFVVMMWCWTVCCTTGDCGVWVGLCGIHWGDWGTWGDWFPGLEFPWWPGDCGMMFICWFIWPGPCPCCICCEFIWFVMFSVPLCNCCAICWTAWACVSPWVLGFCCWTWTTLGAPCIFWSIMMLSTTFCCGPGIVDWWTWMICWFCWAAGFPCSCVWTIPSPDEMIFWWIICCWFFNWFGFGIPWNRWFWTAIGFIPWEFWTWLIMTMFWRFPWPWIIFGCCWTCCWFSWTLPWICCPWGFDTIPCICCCWFGCKVWFKTFCCIWPLSGWIWIIFWPCWMIWM